MKTLISFILFASSALATTQYVSGTGYSSGFCRGDSFSYMCVNQLKDGAERDAARDADFNCRMKQGTLLSYSGSCSTFCNPSIIPNDQNAYVNCNARCNFSCDVRD